MFFFHFGMIDFAGAVSSRKRDMKLEDDELLRTDAVGVEAEKQREERMAEEADSSGGGGWEEVAGRCGGDQGGSMRRKFCVQSSMCVGCNSWSWWEIS